MYRSAAFPTVQPSPRVSLSNAIIALVMTTNVQELLNALPTLGHEAVLLIAIDGCGGAGKSTLADELSLVRDNSQVVHIDDFYKPKEKRIAITEDTHVHSNFDFDRLKTQVLEPLKHGYSATYQTASGEVKEIKPICYVIFEGLGTLGGRIKKLF